MESATINVNLNASGKTLVLLGAAVYLAARAGTKKALKAERRRAKGDRKQQSQLADLLFQSVDQAIFGKSRVPDDASSISTPAKFSVDFNKTDPPEKDEPSDDPEADEDPQNPTS